MKVRLGDLRKLVREEAMRGVPEFALRQATTKYVDDIRQQLFRFVMGSKSETGVARKEAMDAANDVLNDLEEKANDLLEDQLWMFLRRV